MSKTHELKIWPVYFDAIERGDKTFDVRKNDRDFQAGDTLVFKEWDMAMTPHVTENPAHPPVPSWAAPPSPPGAFTGRSLSRVVTYVLHGGQWGLQGDHVVLALKVPENTMDMPKVAKPLTRVWRGRHETRWSDADDNFIMPDGTRANTRYRQKYYAERHMFIQDGANGEAE